MVTFVLEYSGPVETRCPVALPRASSVIFHIQYRIRSPFFFRGPLLLGISSYPPALLTPRLALPSDTLPSPGWAVSRFPLWRVSFPSIRI